MPDLRLLPTIWSTNIPATRHSPHNTRHSTKPQLLYEVVMFHMQSSLVIQRDAGLPATLCHPLYQAYLPIPEPLLASNEMPGDWSAVEDSGEYRDFWSMLGGGQQ